LGRLVEAELLYQRGISPNATYTFKHALIQDAAYQSLLRSTRQQYHQRIAQVLVEHFPEVAKMQPEVVAQHYTAASVHAQALPYWQQAGTRAYDRTAFREAVAAFEQALQALAHLPEDGATRRLALELRLALDHLLHSLAEHGRRLVLLGEAEALARALDDRTRRGGVLARLNMALRQMGDYDGASAAGQQALELAATLGDSILQGKPSFAWGGRTGALATATGQSRCYAGTWRRWTRHLAHPRQPCGSSPRLLWRGT
jgi:tetratricopeptide (TPR) repeat protein